MNVAIYLGLVRDAERTLAGSWRVVGEGHAKEADVHHLAATLAAQCDAHVAALDPLVRRYGSEPETEPERLAVTGMDEVRSGPVGLLRDLHDLYSLASFLDLSWTLLGQAGNALRDRELLDVVAGCEAETANQLAFVRTRLKQAAPQALVGS